MLPAQESSALRASGCRLILSATLMGETCLFLSHSSKRPGLGLGGQTGHMSIPEPITLATETEVKERSGRSQAPELSEAALREGKGGKPLDVGPSSTHPLPSYSHSSPYCQWPQGLISCQMKFKSEI